MITAVPRAQLAGREIHLAALCRFDFDEIADALAVKLIRGSVRDGLPFPKRYRYVCLTLDSGRPCVMSQSEGHQSVVEIALLLERDNYFHETDLLELARAARIPREYLQQLDNGYQWIAVD